MHSLSKIHGGFLRIHRSTQFCFFNSCSCCFYKIRVTSRSLSNSTVAPVRRPQACPFQQFISFEMSKKMNDSDFFFEVVTSCTTTWEASSGLGISLIVFQFKVQCWYSSIHLLSQMRHRPNHGNIVQTASFEKRFQKFLNVWCKWFTRRIKVAKYQHGGKCLRRHCAFAAYQHPEIQQLKGGNADEMQKETKQISTGPCLPTWALALQ